MKTNLFLFICLLFISGCVASVETDDPENPIIAPPAIETSEVINIEANSAFAGGINIVDNNSAITQKGLVWDTTTEPVMQSGKAHLYSIDGGGTDDFTTEMKWLLDETIYYVRAYAINDEGFSYGNELSFTTGTVELDIPCDPDQNSFSVNGTSFNSVETGFDIPLHGTYGLVGHSSNFDFYIGFDGPPRSGVYDNVGFNTPTDFVSTKECSMSITNIGVSPGGVVYVDKLGEDNYSLTFCDISITVGPSTLSIEGNLTTE